MGSFDDLIPGNKAKTNFDDLIPDDGGDFSRGVKQGTLGLKGASGGLLALAGKAVGSEGLTNYGLDVFKGAEARSQELSRPTDSLSGIGGVGDFLDFAARGLGVAAPSIIASLVTGGVGALAGREIAKRGASELASNLARQQALRTGAQVGGIAGATAGSVLPATGGIYPEALAEGVENPELRAIGGGLASGALDVLPLVRAARQIGLIGKMSREAVPESMLGKAGMAAREVGKQAGVESATEGAQTLIERGAAGKALDSPEAIQEVLDSMAIGGLAGGAMGVPGAAMRIRQQPEQPLDVGPTRPTDTAAGDRMRAQEQNDFMRARLAGEQVEAETGVPLMPGTIPEDRPIDLAAGERMRAQQQNDLMRARLNPEDGPISRGLVNAPDVNLGEVFDAADEATRSAPLAAMEAQAGGAQRAAVESAFAQAEQERSALQAESERRMAADLDAQIARDDAVSNPFVPPNNAIAEAFRQRAQQQRPRTSFPGATQQEAPRKRMAMAEDVVVPPAPGRDGTAEGLFGRSANGLTIDELVLAARVGHPEARRMAQSELNRRERDFPESAKPSRLLEKQVKQTRELQETDSLLPAIAKLGGLDRSQAIGSWGLDQQDFRRQTYAGMPVLRKQGGLSLDAMAEKLVERGYLPARDLQAFEELFSEESGGFRRHFTARGEEANMAQELALRADTAQQESEFDERQIADINLELGSMTPEDAVAVAPQPTASPAPSIVPADAPAYLKGQARLMAASATKRGVPSDVVPHPVETGKFAVAPRVQPQAAQVQAAAPSVPTDIAPAAQPTATQGASTLSPVLSPSGIAPAASVSTTDAAPDGAIRVPNWREASRLAKEKGEGWTYKSEDVTDAEGFNVREWWVVPPKKGMSLDEARAYVDRANVERPLGKSWDELERMQGGKMDRRGLPSTAATPSPSDVAPAAEVAPAATSAPSPAAPIAQAVSPATLPTAAAPVSDPDIAPIAPAAQPASPAPDVAPQSVPIQPAGNLPAVTTESTVAAPEDAPAAGFRGRIANAAGRALKREAMENAGQSILEDLAQAKRAPKDVAREFWNETHQTLPPVVRARFENLLRKNLGMEGPIPDLVDELSLGNDASKLEGTERGFVALMEEANRRRTPLREAQDPPQIGPNTPRLSTAEPTTAKGQQTRQWLADRPDVTVVDRQDELPKGGAQIRSGTRVDGMFDPATGKVYVVAEHVPNEARARWVAAHEGGHKGFAALDKATSGEAGKRLAMLRNNRTVRQIAERIGTDRGTAGQAVNLEEALAEVLAANDMKDFAAIRNRYGVSAEQLSLTRNVVQRFMDWMRTWFQQRGATDADAKQLMRDILAESRQGGEGGARLSTAPGTIDVDGKQRPTTNSQGKPIAQDEEASANPDIRYSTVSDAVDYLRSPKTVRGATDAVLGLFKTHGTFNALNKTINTQAYKATKDPLFKRVYDGIQDQMTDTTHYAMEAETQAPDVLLPVKTMKDAGRAWKNAFSSKYRKDIEAIAAPLFANIEGEKGVKQRVFTAAELKADYGLTDKQVEMYQQYRAAIDTSIDRLGQSIMMRMGRALGIDVESFKNTSMADTSDELRSALGLRIKSAEDRVKAAQQEIARLDKQSPRSRGVKSLQLDEQGRLRQEFMIAEKDLAPEEKRLADAESELAGLQKSLAEVDAVAGNIRNLQDSGYTPAMRFGKYAVTAYAGKDQKPEFFGLFESRMAANLQAAKLRRGNPTWDVQQGQIDPQAHELFQKVPPDLAELFGKFMGMEDNAAFKEYVALAASSRSALKRQLEREGTAGFSEDALRVLAAFITSNARAASSNIHGGEINDALLATRDSKRGDVMKEARELVDYVQNPKEEAPLIRGLMFAHFIGGSLAAGMVNMTQPVLMTAPYLSQFAKARDLTGIMGSAMKIATKGKGASPSLTRAMDRAAEEGITDPHEIYHLMAEASGSAVGRSLAARAFNKAWGGFFSAAEAWNRRVTFAAAFQVAEQMTPEALQKSGFSSAYDFAKDAVPKTQGTYNKGNRPNWARGPIGATVFTFKQFSIAYIEFLARLPWKQKVIALSMLSLAAGLEGMPFMEDVQDIIDTVFQKAGFATNSKAWLNRMAASMLGDGMADFVMHGMSALPGVPLDVSGRLGLANLVPGTRLFNPSAKDKDREIAEVAGAPGSFVMGLVKAGSDGKFSEAMPKAIKDVYKAIEMATTGEARDSRGDKVTDATMTDAFTKAIGFQPAHIAEKGRTAYMVQRDIDIQRRVESEIVRAWSNGIADNKPAEVTEARERLQQWNAEHPELPIRIGLAQIRQKVQEKQRTREERIIRRAPVEIRQQIAAELQ